MEMIPARVLGGDDLAARGFTLGALVEDDPLLRHATFPEGWWRRPSEHPDWVYIVDQHGRPRCRVADRLANGRRMPTVLILNVSFYIRECVNAGEVPVLDEEWATRDEVLAALERLRFYEQGAVNIWGDRPSPTAERIVQRARENLARAAEIRAAIEAAGETAAVAAQQGRQP